MKGIIFLSFFGLITLIVQANCVQGQVFDPQILRNNEKENGLIWTYESDG